MESAFATSRLVETHCVQRVIGNLQINGCNEYKSFFLLKKKLNQRRRRPLRHVWDSEKVRIFFVFNMELGLQNFQQLLNVSLNTSG